MPYLARSLAVLLALASLTACTATGTTSASATSSLNEPNTPDAVATAYLRALASGDAAAVCRRLVVNNVPLVDLPSGTINACMRQEYPKLATALPAGLADSAGTLTVSGATISGTTADFTTATFTPAAAASLKNLKAIQVKEQWYIAVD